MKFYKRYNYLLTGTPSTKYVSITETKLLNNNFLMWLIFWLYKNQMDYIKKWLPMMMMMTANFYWLLNICQALFLVPNKY